MGLTVHWDMKYNLNSPSSPAAVLEKIRQRAMDLPFQVVGDMIHLKGKQCNWQERGQDDPLRWFLIQSGAHVDSPHDRRRSYSIDPVEVIGFEVDVAEGSEWMNIKLARYPAFVTPSDEPRFRAGLKGWSNHSFCKTQYASNPDCGGVPNFLRAHISVCTLLEFAATLPGMSVKISDEGKWSTSHYSDDWREAHAAGREATYVDHPASHDVDALAREVCDWNGMIAAFTGALKDGIGDGALMAPILDFPSFEHIEAHGIGKLQDEQIPLFLDALRGMKSPKKAS